PHRVLPSFPTRRSSDLDRIRVRLLAVARDEVGTDRHRLDELAEAINQILDIELAIMLETYREDLVLKNRTAERLATIGQFAASIDRKSTRLNSSHLVIS